MTIGTTDNFNSKLPYPAGAIEDWQHGAGNTWLAQKYGRSYQTVAKMIATQKKLGAERVVELENRRKGGPKKFSEQAPISPVHTAVGVKLNLFRLRQEKMNYEELGRLTHTNRRVARKMELGIHDFTVSELQSISELIGLPVADLMKPATAKA